MAKIVNNKIIDCFQGHKHYGRDQIIPVKLEKTDKAIIEGYSLYLLFDRANKFIDFNKSTFQSYIWKGNEKICTDISFDTKEDLDRYWQDSLDKTGITRLEPIRIILQSGFDYDLFILEKFPGYYCSEKLKNALESMGVTGVKFEDDSHIFVDDEDPDHSIGYRASLIV